MEKEILTRNANNETPKIGALNLEARFMPDTVDTDARTVDVTFATETPVLRRNWYRGTYNEVLSFDSSHVRMERLNKGASFCDNHRIHGPVAECVFGVVERAWIEGSVGRATIRFSKRQNAEEVFNDIVDGILPNVSVGYRVYSYEITEREEGPDDYRAIDWEPFEISTTPVPADFNAQTRKVEDQQDNSTNNVILTFTNNKLNAMSKETRNVPDVKETQPVPPVETRTVTPPVIDAVTPPVKKTTAPDTAQRSETEIAAGERNRIEQINRTAEMAGLEPTGEFVRGLIDAGTALTDAHDQITRKWADNSAPKSNGNIPAGSVTGASEDDTRRESMEIALTHRVNGGELREDARQYRNLSLLGMARVALNARGINTNMMGDKELARTALNLTNRSSAAGSMSSSDFPIVLGNTVNRTLRQAYDLQERTFQAFCRRASIKDFREVTRAQISGMVGKFEEIAEGGEYKAGTFTEGKESYSLKKYGKKIAITWETLVNDDLDAFSRLPSAIAAEAAQLQSDLVYGLIATNANMADGTPLFHADHSNLAGTGTAITITSLSAARTAFRKQKSLNDRYLNLMPKFLIVGPDRETEAQQILASLVVPTEVAKANVFANSLTLVVEPRIGSAWYLAAAPTNIDTIEYAFLEGDGELYTENYTDFDVDGMQIKARMSFATKAIDHRGLYKNAGA